MKVPRAQPNGAIVQGILLAVIPTNGLLLNCIHFLQENQVQYTWHPDEYERSEGPDDDAIELALSEWELEEEDERLRQLQDRWDVLERCLPRGCKCGERLLYERDYGTEYRAPHSRQRTDSVLASEAMLEAQLGERFAKWSNTQHATGHHTRTQREERDQQSWGAGPKSYEPNPPSVETHAMHGQPPLMDNEVARLRHELAEQKARNRDLDDRLKLIEQQQSNRIMRVDSLHGRKPRVRAVADLGGTDARTLIRSASRASPSFNELSNDLTWDTMELYAKKQSENNDAVHHVQQAQHGSATAMYTHGTDRLQPQWMTATETVGGACMLKIGLARCTPCLLVSQPATSVSCLRRIGSLFFLRVDNRVRVALWFGLTRSAKTTMSCMTTRISWKRMTLEIKACQR